MAKYVERLESHATLKFSDHHYSPPIQSILTFYVQGHPMKPHRMRMTHNLLLHYGLHSLMEVSSFYFTCSKDCVNTGRNRSTNRHQPVLKS